MIDGLATHLLWRHVASGAHDHAWIGALSLSRRVAVRVSVRLDQLGESEVENLDAAGFGHEEVLGLEVAMDDAVIMRGRQSMSDLYRVIDGFASGQRAAL